MTVYEVDGSGIFTVHKNDCFHLRKARAAELTFTINADTDDRDGVLVGIDNAGTYRAEGTSIAFAPCVKGLPGGTHDDIGDEEGYAILYPNRPIRKAKQ